MIQEIVDAHAARVQKQVDDFVGQLQSVTSEVKRIVIAHLRRSLIAENGAIFPMSNNASVMRELDRTYAEALTLAGYHGMLGGFVANFSNQVDEFMAMYATMRSRVSGLPELRLDVSSVDVLGTRAAMSLAALESSTVEVSASLRQAAVLVWGDLPQDFMVNHIGEVIDRTARVGQLAKELMVTFFRNVSTLFYEAIEVSDISATYKYVGLVNVRNRAFCRGLMGEPLATKAQISRLDNGQIPDVFHNAGGRGCSHFWWIEGTK